MIDHDAPTELDSAARPNPTLVPEPLSPLPVRSLPGPPRPEVPSQAATLPPQRSSVPLTAIATAAVVMTFLACAALVTAWVLLWRSA